jgi:hypothetical protein
MLRRTGRMGAALRVRTQLTSLNSDVRVAVPFRLAYASAAA